MLLRNLFIDNEIRKMLSTNDFVSYDG